MTALWAAGSCASQEAAESQQSRHATGTIHGQVVDDLGNPLPGVVIMVLGTSRGAVTDEDGAYKVTRIPPGNIWVQAMTICHARDSIQVSLQPSVSKEVDFKLPWSPLEVSGDCCEDRSWYDDAVREGKVCV